jgi:UrcA family protein
MTTLLKAISVAAGVSMAALTMAASAQAAEAVRIQVSDLNLNTPQGRAAFDARVTQAAHRICAGDRTLSGSMACERAVRQEAQDNLRDQQEQVARAGGVNLATAGRR